MHAGDPDEAKTSPHQYMDLSADTAAILNSFFQIAIMEWQGTNKPQ